VQYDFDAVRERTGTDSMKWQRYGDDVIPLWLADMDFVSPEAVIRALHQRADHAIFGYTQPAEQLRQVIQERLEKLYQWHVQDEEIVFLPSLVTGINLSFLTCTRAGEAVVAHPPVYHHFINDPISHGRAVIDPPLVQRGDTYEVDFDAFERAITDHARIFILCNPHNPVARVYTMGELAQMAEICLRHDLMICSDEIHCDLLYPGHQHIPMATLGSQVADQTITLMAPSKTFNVPGLGCGFAVIKNPELRRRLEATGVGIVPHVNIMGHVAALAAYKDGQEWLDQILVYLQDNRDFLDQYVKDNLPGIRMIKMEATYLAWLDCRAAGIPGNPFQFFLKEAGVALSDGAGFGRGGKGFVRLNFACPRKTLTEALDRMADAFEKL